MGVKNAAATFNRKISINRCHSMVTKGNRNKTITLNPCVIHNIFFLSRSSEITPANGEKIIYAETRNVSADASMAADRAALSSYDSSARPSQVNASPNRLAVCEIKSFPNVLFFSIRKGALITLLNIFKVVLIIDTNIGKSIKQYSHFQIVLSPGIQLIVKIIDYLIK